MKKLYIRTFGCQMNEYDSDKMADVLGASEELVKTDNPEEADVILFHPYDEGHWGFDRMPAAADDRYLRYVVARLGAYRNVWWSLANEFDFMKTKTDADWERFARVVADSDPYDHLLSIHNGTRLFNHTHPLLTHASIQNGSAVADFGRALLYRDVYRKPVVFDEVKYEGDFEQRWGNLSGEEMTHRFWQGTIAGTYVGHGETYRNPDDLVWWSKGGKLRGKSPERIEVEREESYRRQHAAILSGNPGAACTYAEGYRVLRLIHAVERAAAEGSWRRAD